MNSSAARSPENPWDSRVLPRRPTRLVAVPPARSRPQPVPAPRPSPAHRARHLVRGAGLAVEIGGELLEMAGESLAFLSLLAVLLAGLWIVGGS